MFVDLDDFKAINDALGHGAGDLVLQTIAWRLRQSCRAEDTVCRYGGDEFLYLLCDMRDDHDIERVALKVVESIQEPCEVVVRGVMVRKRVEASLGIAVFPRDGRTSEALIKRADGAMYQAKRSERAYVFAQ